VLEAVARAGGARQGTAAERITELSMSILPNDHLSETLLDLSHHRTIWCGNPGENGLVSLPQARPFSPGAETFLSSTTTPTTITSPA
jgi:hypothetical protein